jgi:hypothetical protein
VSMQCEEFLKEWQGQGLQWAHPMRSYLCSEEDEQVCQGLLFMVGRRAGGGGGSAAAQCLSQAMYRSGPFQLVLLNVVVWYLPADC